jgi:hypothetical protein
MKDCQAALIYVVGGGGMGTYQIKATGIGARANRGLAGRTGGHEQVGGHVDAASAHHHHMRLACEQDANNNNNER